MRPFMTSMVQSFRQTSLRWRIGMLMIVILLVVAILFIPKPEFSKNYFRSVGYPGVFVVTLIANASVILPAPGFLAVIAAGTVLNPFWVGLLGAAGMALGELTGYLLGRAGHALSAKEFTTEVAPGKFHDKWISTTQRLVNKWGMIGIIILAATPNPLFDVAGIAAGAARMGLYRFLLATFVGRLIRTMLLAYAAHYSIGGITDLFD